MVKKAGFTLIEVVVAASLISVASAIIIPNLPRMNSRFAAELLSYDVALAIRGVQALALTAPGGYVAGNSRPYGLNFRTAAGQNQQFVSFQDTDRSFTLNVGDAAQSTSLFQVPSTVNMLCTKTGAAAMVCGSATSVDILFRRPNPDAIITANGIGGVTYSGAGIQIRSLDTGVEKCVRVYSTGQVSVQPAPCS